MIKFSGCSVVLVIYFWLLDCSAVQSEIQVQHVDNDFGSSVRQQCAAQFLHCIMILQVPREALEFAGMSINFRSGKFGYSICPIFSKGHAEIFREF